MLDLPLDIHETRVTSVETALRAFAAKETLEPNTSGRECGGLPGKARRLHDLELRGLSSSMHQGFISSRELLGEFIRPCGWFRSR